MFYVFFWFSFFIIFFTGSPWALRSVSQSVGHWCLQEITSYLY